VIVAISDINGLGGTVIVTAQSLSFDSSVAAAAAASALDIFGWLSQKLTGSSRMINIENFHDLLIYGG